MQRGTSRQGTSVRSTLISLVVFVALLVVAWLIGELRGAVVAGPTPTPAPVTAAAPAANPSTPGRDFDFWILALSWSPDYCATDGEDDAQQCSVGRKLGFVLHGLWPQYNRGYPSFCSNEDMPTGLAANFPNLYPSSKLYSYQWEKHGTCSGLPPAGYLATSARIKGAVTIPEAYRNMPQPLRTTPQEIKKNFLAANSGMREWSMAVFCSGSGRYLSEVWICVGLDEALTACSSEIRSRESSSCQGSNVIMRNMR